MMSFALALAKCNCFLLPYMRHASPITKIYGLLELIIMPLLGTCYPTALKGFWCIVFTHGVRMGGWVDGRVAGKFVWAVGSVGS